MKNDTMERIYSKDIEIDTFILQWIPITIAGTLFFICLCISAKIVTEIVFKILFDRDFSIIDYFTRAIFADLDAPIFIGFLFSLFFLYEGATLYRRVKKNPFATIEDETLILNFGKNSFTWDQIQAVHTEGNKKLIITFVDKGKPKERAFDLKWLQNREHFILNLKKNCVKREILYHESELTFFSRVGLFLNFWQ